MCWWITVAVPEARCSELGAFAAAGVTPVRATRPRWPAAMAKWAAARGLQRFHCDFGGCACGLFGAGHASREAGAFFAALDHVMAGGDALCIATFGDTPTHAIPDEPGYRELAPAEFAATVRQPPADVWLRLTVRKRTATTAPPPDDS